MTYATKRNYLQYRTGIPALIVLICCLLYAGFSLMQLNWDPLGFATYDGHFSYQIALRFLESPHYLDVPAYRFQRIAYPFIVRLLSFVPAAVGALGLNSGEYWGHCNWHLGDGEIIDGDAS